MLHEERGDLRPVVHAAREAIEPVDDDALDASLADRREEPIEPGTRELAAALAVVLVPLARDRKPAERPSRPDVVPARDPLRAARRESVFAADGASRIDRAADGARPGHGGHESSAEMYGSMIVLGKVRSPREGDRTPEERFFAREREPGPDGACARAQTAAASRDRCRRGGVRGKPRTRTSDLASSPSSRGACPRR